MVPGFSLGFFGAWVTLIKGLLTLFPCVLLNTVLVIGFTKVTDGVRPEAETVLTVDILNAGCVILIPGLDMG